MPHAIKSIKKSDIKLVKSFPDILRIRNIRNDCRSYLTNYIKYISVFQQTRWYFSYYIKALSLKKYRIYILRNKESEAVGYGALSLQDNKLYVTECLKSEFRHQGYGTAILKHLITIADREKRSIVAEIWKSNKKSIALHKKFGFKLKSTKLKNGQKLCVYFK